jgi:CheY-like chemotaxis protein
MVCASGAPGIEDESIASGMARPGVVLHPADSEGFFFASAFSACSAYSASLRLFCALSGLTAATEMNTITPSAAPDPASGSTEDAPTFLTVDDEPDINWILGRLIAQRGFRAHHAGCGQEAIELNNRYRYRAVFVDAKLPDIEGLVLIEHLRRVQQDPFIILISGYFFSDDPVVEQALKSGLIQGFVAKPFLHSEILALVDRITAAAPA